AVFYAPFWIFDVQPLPANVTALLYLLLASAYLRFREQGRVLWLAVAGLLLGLSIATHGLAIFALALFLFDLASRHKQAGQQRKVLLAVLLVTTMLVPTLVSLRNSLAAGTPMFVSYNAGINLFIGNHRDLEETLGRRGGYEWGELFRAPYQSGAKEPGQLNRYFVGRAIDEWLEAPGALLLTTGQKLLMAFGANETKRNFPIYPLREDSALLRLLLFEVSLGDLVLFAFPGGLILPLALLGLFQVGRGDLRSRLPRERALLAGKLALVHLLGMIVFFPTARYRLPALVVLFPYMGVMVVYLYDQLRRLAARAGDARMVLSRGAVPVLVLFVALNVGAANVFRHPVEDRAEDLYFGALWDYQRLQRVDSVFLSRRLLAQVEEATRIDPDYPEPVGLVAIYYLYRDIEQSLAYFARLGELVPNDRDVLQQIREAQAIRDAGK
ncbi:MAG: hypothetical protein GY944_15215, partial [bacterium]|nr:hypothetical protein [bacterium]